jgi:shikimate 5-dehydrogenase
MKYYLIGKNIETSLSPKIHNFLFKLKSRKPTYQEAISGRLFSLREMQDDSFGGMSITIPYKSMFKDEPLIEKRGDVCTKYGIANTVFKD